MKKPILNLGDFIFVKDDMRLLKDPDGWRVAQFQGISINRIKTNGKFWHYGIPFKKFNPTDMNKTLQFLLRVKEGELVRKPVE